MINIIIIIKEKQQKYLVTNLMSNICFFTLLGVL